MSGSSDAGLAAVRPRRNPGLRLVTVDQGQALLAGEGPVRHLLNDTALAIWQVCDGSTSVAEMVVAVTELFGLPEEQARRQVEAAVVQMTEAGLVLWGVPDQREAR